MSKVLSLSRPAYLGQVFLVIDHEIDEKVRLRLADAEECFSPLISAEVKSTNVDANAPPDVPRLALNDNHKNISLAKNRIQFSLNFDSSFNIDKAFNIIKKNAEDFFLAAKKFQNLSEKTQVGFVVHVNQPCEDPKEVIAQYLADHLYSGEFIGDLATFDIRLGFKTGSNLYKNFSFNIYEVREFKIPNDGRSQGEITIRVDDVPTKETGLASILDVNNKARLLSSEGNLPRASFEETAKEVLSEMSTMLSSDRNKILSLNSATLQGKS